MNLKKGIHPMNLKKTLLSVLMILQLCLLVGCDYIEKASKVDDLVTQQELQKSKIEALEKQQELDKRKIEHFEKQQITIINSTNKQYQNARWRGEGS